MSTNFQLASDQINELAAALSKAQGQMTFAAKDSKNPHFKNDYASLASVIDGTRKALAENGLSVVQSPVPMDGSLILVTTLMHSSGQWQRSYTPIIMTKSDAQGMGSALTYARRYSWSAMTGLAQDDDDGEGSINRPKQTAPDHKQASNPRVETVLAKVAPKTTHATAKTVYPSKYPEQLARDESGKARCIEDFSTDELSLAADYLEKWKGKPTFTNNAGKALDLIYEILNSRQPKTDLDEALDFAMGGK